MSVIRVFICSVLSVTLGISEQNIDTSNIRVFPALHHSIAGVFQASYMNKQNQVQYAFNASEARTLCSSLGVVIASKDQVQEALTRGLETCRFGWTDEHLAVIPRVKPQSTCGQNQTGLVTWRASVTRRFDVFCFNESDMVAQIEDATQLPSEPAPTSRSSTPTLPSFILINMDSEAEKALIVGSAQGSSGKKAVLITSALAVLLIAVVIFAYIRRKRKCSDKKQQEYIETEEWICVTKTQEPKKAASEEERIEVDKNTS
ncbi:lymphatic vessel endothelial hyaluronic acid receptor 1a isoform X2 [Sphaeramia orbicularis]|uniref:lymphatic vessel endothelial hyaluronic acid receptor 1a isoform X2 n=1 Tax=Sphaeramia orbicularis TaxID=375764 RepID=UPI00118126D6|nr:lymphatic vessel endothelial hyaluronic acid receptor 1 isoform X2 [Sphaeramia orbicularis]